MVCPRLIEPRTRGASPVRLSVAVRRVDGKLMVVQDGEASRKNAKRQAVEKQRLRDKADAKREADAKRAKGPPLTPPPPPC